MDMQAEKVKLIKWLQEVTDEHIIERIKLLKERQFENLDWWDELSEIEKQSIERGLKDVENGDVKTHEEVMKIYEKWL